MEPTTTDSSKNGQPVNDRSNLDALYPKAKTSVDRLKDHQDREISKQNKRHNARLKAVRSSIAGAILLGLSIVLLSIASRSVSPVATALLVFPAGLVGVGSLVWIISSIKKIIYE